MLRLLALAGLVTILAGAPAGAASPSEPAAPARCAGAPAELGERCALAAELNEVMQTANLMRDGIRQTTETVFSGFAPGNEQRADKLERIIREELMEAFEPVIPAFLEFNRDLIAEAFSAVELAEMIRFYKSDVGRKLVATQPHLQAQGILAGRAMGEAAMQRALPRIIDRLRAGRLVVPSTL